MARIPNEEVRLEFVDALKETTHPILAGMVSSADKLLLDTLAGDEESVAQGIDQAHDSRLGPDWYNDEQALRFAVKLAYLTAVDRFAEIEELPSGHGRADIVYIPRRYDRIPAIIVELKWDKDPDSALDQIHRRDYPKVLRDYGGFQIVNTFFTRACWPIGAWPQTATLASPEPPRRPRPARLVHWRGTAWRAAGPRRDAGG